MRGVISLMLIIVRSVSSLGYSTRMMHSLINIVIFSGKIRDTLDHELLQIKFVNDIFPCNGFPVAPTREFDRGRGGKSVKFIGIMHDSPL